MRRFTANVWVTTRDGSTFHEIGSEVPDDCPVGDHCWAEVDESYLAATGDQAGDGDDPVFAGQAEPDDDDEGESDGPVTRPPTSGPGASRGAWRAFYRQVNGEAAPQSWTREDLIQSLADAD